MLARMFLHAWLKKRRSAAWRWLIGTPSRFRARKKDEMAKKLSDAEIAAAREQLAKANRAAERIAKMRGYRLHPRLKDFYAALAQR